MPDPISFGELEFNIVSDMNGSGGEATSEKPFRIAVLGDFSGRAQRGLREIGEALANRPRLAVDRDNVESILARLDVRVVLPGTGPDDAPETIKIKELDDFHPDHLYEKIQLFQTFQTARKKAADPAAFAATFAAAAGEKPVKKKPAPAPPAEAPIPSSTGLLDDVLAVTAREAGEEAPPPKRDTEWDRYLQQLVEPHTVPDTSAQRTALTSALDAAAGDMMRAILHYPDFQKLEAIWRALAFLVYRVETDEQLQIFLIDISKEELAADLASAEDLRSTGTYDLLVEQTVGTPGAAPWSLLVGAYSFGPSPADVEILGRMAKIAHQANAAFIAGARDRLLGCDALARTPDPSKWQTALPENERRAWETLRKLPEASRIGLAMPRFLLRLPYGADTDPTERFDFEEMPGRPAHEDYLWGNPAFACAYLLASAFSREGWQFLPGAEKDIDRLPLHLYKAEGERQNKPCGEVMLTERAASAILDTGLMPLVTFKDQDKVRLVRFQSITQPATQLGGPWRHA